MFAPRPVLTCLLLCLVWLLVAGCGDPEPVGARPSDAPPGLDGAQLALLEGIGSGDKDGEAAEVRRAIRADEGLIQRLVDLQRSGTTSTIWRRRAGRVLVIAGGEALPAILRAFVDARDQEAKRYYVLVRTIIPTAGCWIQEQLPAALQRNLSDEQRASLRAFEAPLLRKARLGASDERRFAVLIVSALPPEARSAESVPLLVDALMTEEPALMQDAACALIGSAAVAEPAVERLLRLLDQPEGDARDMALAILPALGAHWPAVGTAFAQRMERVEDKAEWGTLVHGLGAMGENAKPALPLLARALADPRSSRHGRALEALIAMGDIGDAPLATGLTTVDGPQRLRLLKGLAGYGAEAGPGLRAALRTIKASADEQEAAAAAAALAGAE
jgi:hypothetical protein